MDQNSPSNDPPQNSARASRNWRKLGAVSRLANASRRRKAGSNPGEPSEIRTPPAEHLSEDVSKALIQLAKYTLYNGDDEGYSSLHRMMRRHCPTMSDIKEIGDMLEKFKKNYHIDQCVEIQWRSNANSNEESADFWNKRFRMCEVLQGFIDSELKRNTVEDTNEPQVHNEENPVEDHIHNISSLCMIVENIIMGHLWMDGVLKEKVVFFVNKVVRGLQAYPNGNDFEVDKLYWAGRFWGNDVWGKQYVNPTTMQDFGTALHWAVELEDKTLVAAILASEEADINAASNWMKGTPLHMAVLKGNLDIVRQLLQCKERIRLTEADIVYRTPIEIAHTMGFTDIERALMECDAVSLYVDALYKNRQVYVDAANAILVGAALIASVTFASWLQPPLGYILEGHVNVQDNGGLLAFWVFNSLSFYFAIGTVVFGARSVLPRQNVFIRTIVERLRINLLVTSILLGCSVFFVIIAFGIAGCIVLTPTFKVQLTMIVPTIVGGLLCVISLKLLFQNVWDERKGARSGNTNQYFFPSMNREKLSLIQKLSLIKLGSRFMEHMFGASTRYRARLR